MPRGNARIKTINFKLGPFNRKLEKEVEQNMTQAVQFAEGKIKESISRGNKGGGNPSRPGEPPKVRSGRLRSSITHEVTKELGGIVGRVGTNVVYARWLELGTENMEPRPFLRPGILNNQRRIFNIISGGRVGL